MDREISKREYQFYGDHIAELCKARREKSVIMGCKLKKIAIFQADLHVGGIQRSLVNLLRSDILKDFEVDVYLFDKEIFYDISAIGRNIHIHILKPFPYWYRFIPFRVIKRIHHIPVLGQYDFSWDYDSYRQECALYACSQPRARHIMWIHSDMIREYHFNKKYRVLYFFFKNKYRYFDEFVAVSEGVIESFRTQSRQYEKKVTVIPNPINVKEIFDKSQEETNILAENDAINIACMGRIYVAKGYDKLLQDFEKAYHMQPKLRLYILGDGPDRSHYQTWVEQHGISKAVYFLGNQKNPFSILKQMDAFCIESRYEGQGMVLWEAKALGLPLIFPRHLEKYNIYLEGVDDIPEAMAAVGKKEKQQDDLKEYDAYIREQYCHLLN